MKPALLYARVSTSSQTDGASLESQIHACREYARQNGYTITREAAETFSGSYLFDRPLLSECREEIRSGKYDAIIVYDIDRLSRNVPHLGILLDECDRYNTKLLFVKTDFERSPEGMLLFSIRGYLAEAERLKIIERTTRGRRHKAKAGTLSFKRKLFGYIIDENGKRQIYEPEAGIIRMMYQRFLSGDSLWAIAHHLNEANTPKATGRGVWWANSVRDILTNPAYCGRTVIFRQKKVSRYESGERILTTTRTDSEAHVELPKGTTPAIVSEDDYENVLKILAHNKANKRRKPTMEALLRGMITCGSCGRTMSPRMSYKWGYYVCTSKQNRATNCGTKMIGARVAEETVWQAALKYIKNPAKIEKMILKEAGQSVKSNKAETDLKQIETSIQKVEREIQNLASRIASVDESIWHLVKEQLELKQKELNYLLGLKTEALERLQKVDNIKIDAKAAADIARELLPKIDTLDFEGRVEALHYLRATIVWNGQELSINFGGIGI